MNDNIKVFLIFVIMLSIPIIGFLTLPIIKQQEEGGKGIFEESIYQIKSLKYQRNIQGSFTLGSGGINEIDYYYAYKINDDLSYSLVKLRASQSKIIEDGQNYVKILCDNSSFWSVCRGANKYGAVNNGVSFYGTIIEIHLPKDSIIEQYNPNIN